MEAFDKIMAVVTVVLFVVLISGLAVISSERRQCHELGYQSSSQGFCLTRVNGTDIVVPLDEAKQRPRPSQ